MPSATSRAIDPLGMISTATRCPSPRRMTEPLPYWRSICPSAASSAFARSMLAIAATLSSAASPPATGMGTAGIDTTLGRAPDIPFATHPPGEELDRVTTWAPPLSRRLYRTYVRMVEARARRVATLATRGDQAGSIDAVATRRRNIHGVAEGVPDVAGIDAVL